VRCPFRNSSYDGLPVRRSTRSTRDLVVRFADGLSQWSAWTTNQCVVHPEFPRTTDFQSVAAPAQRATWLFVSPMDFPNGQLGQQTSALSIPKFLVRRTSSPSRHPLNARLGFSFRRWTFPMVSLDNKPVRCPCQNSSYDGLPVRRSTRSTRDLVVCFADGLSQWSAWTTNQCVVHPEFPRTTDFQSVAAPAQRATWFFVSRMDLPNGQVGQQTSALSILNFLVRRTSSPSQHPRNARLGCLFRRRTFPMVSLDNKPVRCPF
jgi:hypothetical protein